MSRGSYCSSLRVVPERGSELHQEVLRHACTVIAVFDNDDPARFATLHSAHLTYCSIKMLMNMLPTVTLTLTTLYTH